MLDRQTDCDANSRAANDLLLGLVERLTHEHEHRIRPAVSRIERLIVSLVYQHGLGHFQLAALARCYVELADRLAKQMREEEAELFPSVLAFDKSRYFDHASQHFRKRLCVSEDEHHAIAAVFNRIRVVTDDYQSPPSACRDYARLLENFSSLDATLQKHWDVEEQLLLHQIEAQDLSHPPLVTQES